MSAIEGREEIFALNHVSPHHHRFVKCEKCSHFFVVLSDTDTGKYRWTSGGRPGPELDAAAGVQGRAGGTPAAPERKLPPPPKKIYEYLNRVRENWPLWWLCVYY